MSLHLSSFPEVVCPPQDHLHYVTVMLKNIQGRPAVWRTKSELLDLTFQAPHTLSTTDVSNATSTFSPTPGPSPLQPCSFARGVGEQNSGRLPRSPPSERPSTSVSFPAAPRLAQGDWPRATGSPSGSSVCCLPPFTVSHSPGVEPGAHTPSDTSSWPRVLRLQEDAGHWGWTSWEVHEQT